VLFRSGNETAANVCQQVIGSIPVFGQLITCIVAAMAKPKSEDIANLDIVEKFETYEDYLDSQLTANDMGYLEDEEMARQLVELGYRGLGDTIRREVHCISYFVDHIYAYLSWVRVSGFCYQEEVACGTNNTKALGAEEISKY
jgi:hypothetical protein